MDGITGLMPYVGGGGGAVAIAYLIWRIVIWADVRTRADNNALRQEIKGLRDEIERLRRELHSAQDLAAENRRQLILAGLYQEEEVRRTGEVDPR